MRTILYMFLAHPNNGLTAKEVELYLHMPGAWKRVSDLKAAGLGWRILRVVPSKLCTEQTITYITDALKWRVEEAE